MTGGGDTDEIEDIGLDELYDEIPVDDEGGEERELHLNTNDPDPTAGASDIGGRAATPEDDDV